jgi:hypothetical protein
MTKSRECTQRNNDRRRGRMPPLELYNGAEDALEKAGLMSSGEEGK